MSTQWQLSEHMPLDVVEWEVSDQVRWVASLITPQNNLKGKDGSGREIVKIVPMELNGLLEAFVTGPEDHSGACYFARDNQDEVWMYKNDYPQELNISSVPNDEGLMHWLVLSISPLVSWDRSVLAASLEILAGTKAILDYDSRCFNGISRLWYYMDKPINAIKAYEEAQDLCTFLNNEMEDQYSFAISSPTGISLKLPCGWIEKSGSRVQLSAPLKLPRYSAGNVT